MGLKSEGMPLQHSSLNASRSTTCRHKTDALMPEQTTLQSVLSHALRRQSHPENQLESTTFRAAKHPQSRSGYSSIELNLQTSLLLAALRPELYIGCVHTCSETVRARPVLLSGDA